MNYLVLGVIIFLGIGIVLHQVLPEGWKEPAVGVGFIAVLPALSDVWAALTFVLIVCSIGAYHIKYRQSATPSG